MKLLIDNFTPGKTTAIQVRKAPLHSVGTAMIFIFVSI